MRPGEATAEFTETVEFWRRWVAQSQYRGRWREMVAPLRADAQAADLPADRRHRRRPHDEPARGRSAAARNWDYRYTWIRDAAFTLYALLRLGFTDEAGAFMDWLERPHPRARAPPTDRPAADHVRHRRARAT